MRIGKLLIVAFAVFTVLMCAASVIFRPSRLYEGESGAPEETEGGRILDVPFVHQKGWYCSEASASMVLSYYRYDVSQDEVHDNGYDSFETMLPFLSRFVSCEYASLSMSDLKDEIDEGDPVIIRVCQENTATR